MPELPEVETVKNFLETHIVGQKTLKIKIIIKKLKYEIPTNINNKLSNLILTKISRRGKYLIFFYNNGKALLCHLGMTGYFRICQKIQKKKHDHIIFFFKEKILVFNDIRKFGFIKILSAKDVFGCNHLANIGPEPLSREFNFNYFKKKNSSSAVIKNLLMDQKFVAGLGNIYCSEILFEAKISPQRLVKTLKDNEIERLIISIKKILKESIKCGGTTIKNFIVSDEKIGYFKNKLKVYGRLNQPCLRCCSIYKVSRLYLAGRSTFYCSNCQF